MSRTYNNFATGRIANSKNQPKPRFKDRAGETNIMHNGQVAEIIAYRGAEDIDIKFEDGTIIGHRTYGRFADGHIHNPNFSSKSPLTKDRVGEERIMNCGLKAKITRYKKSQDIDVQFDDGTVVSHITYQAFATGKIKHPSTRNHGFIDRTGETIKLSGPKEGLTATIIRYGSCRDIDAKLSNGKIAKNITYQQFKKGLLYPGGLRRDIDHTGETIEIPRLGITATITRYHNARDIDVKMSDGRTKEHIPYSRFKAGQLGIRKGYKPKK